MNEKELIQFYIENDILISPELLVDIKNKPLPLRTEFSVMSKEVLIVRENNIPINIEDFEKSIVLKEKHKNAKLYNKFLEYITQHLDERLKNSKNNITSRSIIGKDYEEQDKQLSQKQSHSLVPDIALSSNTTNIGSEAISSNTISNTISNQIHSPFPNEEKISATFSGQEIQEKDMDVFRKIFLDKNRAKLTVDYNEKTHKRTVQDFVNYFSSRYKELEKILRTRQELQSLTSIARINAKKEKENVSFIGFVYEKGLTKNGNIMMTIEDPTGFIKVVIGKTKEELFKLAEEIQLDEVIGITGTYDKIVFVNNLFLPDIPLTKELKKSPDEGYFVVITDPQVGNKLFLEKEFNKFISWINGEVGSDVQKDIASKVKYIFLVGDLVDGVGIYPDQEYDLSIIDIKSQYDACAEYIKRMPKHIPIFACPGNHDVGRISEPQPRFHDAYTKAIWTIPNVIPVSNPSYINIFANPEKGFDGFDVLLYHGYSFVYYAYNIKSIRQKGDQKRPDLIMKYLLQRRHLAPTHTSTLYIPEPKKDYLTIDKVPDFFFSGHIHRSSVSSYRNVTCINASCWVAKSSEQERRGLEPQPGRAFVINMQTREIKVMNFMSKSDKDEEDSDSKSDDQINLEA